MLVFVESFAAKERGCEEVCDEMSERPCGEGQTAFDAALWRWWPSLFPAYTASVAAPNAFSAVALLMRIHEVQRVARAAADAVDGSLRYRACGVRLGGMNGSECCS
jgi:hypothetical protein